MVHVAPANPHRNAGRPRANGLKASLDTRRDILDAAAILFVRRGFAGASTQAIAAAAGLRQPTLFHYFKTKEAILEELYMASLSEPLAAFARIEALSAPAPADRKSTRLNSSHSCAYSMPSSAGKKKITTIRYNTTK